LHCTAWLIDRTELNRGCGSEDPNTTASSGSLGI